jgi:energy-coupling factor transporter ATP-binding protein EcfA2
MLTKLTLRNFQCHRKLEIPLSQITTIVGSSDSGKSAIVRALNYVCLNNLRGNSFITHGKDKCAVMLEADDQKIRRIKTKTENSYTTETNEFSAVSSEVPLAITKILNIGEINIANQHDPLFWFSLTPGQLAKELNAIADIAWVDRVLQVSVSDCTLCGIWRDLRAKSTRRIFIRKPVRSRSVRR